MNTGIGHRVRSGLSRRIRPIRGKRRAIILFLIGVILLIAATFLPSTLPSQAMSIVESISIGFITIGVIAYFYDEALKQELRKDFFETMLKGYTKTDGVAAAIESIPLNVRWLRRDLKLEYEIRLEEGGDVVKIDFTMEYDVENRTLESMHYLLSHYIAPDPAIDSQLTPEWTVYSARVKEATGERWLRKWQKGQEVPDEVSIGPVDWPYDGTINISDELRLEPYGIPGFRAHIFLRARRVLSAKEYDRWSATAITENLSLRVRYDRDLELTVALQHPRRKWTSDYRHEENGSKVARYELDQVFLPYQGVLIKWNPRRGD